MSAATIILAQMNRYVRLFREENATTPERAIIPQEYGIRNSFAFQKLVRQGILIRVNNERYYLDEEKELVYRKRRRSIAQVMFILILIGIIIALLATRK